MRLHLSLIRFIGLIVPRRLRMDWRQEWEAELRWREMHLSEWDRLDWRSKLDLFWRSLGACRDALILQPRRLEDEMFQDLRYGARMLFKQPGFTLVAVLTLALGIGSTTAIFSVIYGVLISPYPYANPHEIWTPGLKTVRSNQRMRPYSLVAYEEMARLPVFSEVMATSPDNVLLTGEYAPESIGGVRMSGNAFRFLGVSPILGRAIQPSDIRSTGEPEPVAVLSFQRWQRLFGGDPNAIGKKLRLNDEEHTIIGVMPPRFGWWTSDGVWLPLGTSARNTRLVFPIARLAVGMTPAAAEDQLHALHLELAKAAPDSFPKEEFSTQLTNYLDITVASGEMERSLILLFIAVAILLLIACANVANLQLVKASARAREMAIRLSLGAGRIRILRQLLTESMLLSLLGGVLGLVFAYWITYLIVALMPSDYVPNEARIEVNGYVLSFSLIVSVLTGILFGLAPALQSSRPDLVKALKDESRSSSAAAGGRVRALLVVAEVALSVVLLVSASLTARSFLALQGVELGFQPEQVSIFGLPLPPKRYATIEQRNGFARELVERVKTIPGVEAATIGSGGLPFGGPQLTYSIEGQAESETRRIRAYAVSADYLRTLGIPLRRGRMFTEQEVERGDRVAVINEAAARLWPAGEDPIGRRVKLNELERPGRSDVLVPAIASPYVTVVGVIGNARNDDFQNLRSEPVPAVAIPSTLVVPAQRVFAVRARIDAKTLASAVRAAVSAIDREQPLNGPVTIEEMLGRMTAQPRFSMLLFSLFAALGLALALAGIYSVLSYLVAMRTREIGVRMAMGARPADIIRLFMRAGGRLVAVGMMIGLLASFAASRLLRSQLDLFQVSAFDPVSFAGVAVLLLVVAMAACFIPARRATRVDPMIALRYE